MTVLRRLVGHDHPHDRGDLGRALRGEQVPRLGQQAGELRELAGREAAHRLAVGRRHPERIKIIHNDVK